jgi:bacterioferritin|tara:strand:- start:74 stop:544 length:471 start_codon:yes stop_codon:yes gene_type:complete
MKGETQVIEALNEVLMAELTAINMYYVQYRMKEDWGYKKLADHDRSESMDEMRHADKMICRILYLDGSPDMQKYDTIMVGKTVEEQLKNQYKAECDHVERLQRIIAICIEKRDFGSKEILDSILEDTEDACDWIETQFQCIKDVGIQNYLAENMHG